MIKHTPPAGVTGPNIPKGKKARKSLSDIRYNDPENRKMPMVNSFVARLRFTSLKCNFNTATPSNASA